MCRRIEARPVVLTGEAQQLDPIPATPDGAVGGERDRRDWHSNNWQHRASLALAALALTSLAACLPGPRWTTTRLLPDTATHRPLASWTQWTVQAPRPAAGGLAVAVSPQRICRDLEGRSSNLEITTYERPNSSLHVMGTTAAVAGISIAAWSLRPTSGENWAFLTAVPFGAVLVLGGGIVAATQPWADRVVVRHTQLPSTAAWAVEKPCGALSAAALHLELKLPSGEAFAAQTGSDGIAYFAIPQDRHAAVLAEPLLLSVNNQPIRLLMPELAARQAPLGAP